MAFVHGNWAWDTATSAAGITNGVLMMRASASFVEYFSLAIECRFYEALILKMLDIPIYRGEVDSELLCKL